METVSIDQQSALPSSSSVDSVPAVVYNRYWKHSLSSHSGIPTHCAVRLEAHAGIRCCQEHASSDDCIAAIVWSDTCSVRIGVNDDHLIRRFARDIGVIASAFLRAKLYAMASWVTRQRSHNRVSARIDDRDCWSQGVRTDRILTVRTHRCLNW